MFDKDDSELCDKLHKAKTAEEYTGNCSEEGTGLSVEEKENISAAFEQKNAGSLNDEELNGVAGGYIPIFDECRDSWNQEICMRKKGVMGHTCENLMRIKIETDQFGRAYAYYKCWKGCFSSLKLDITYLSDIK